MSTYTPSLGQLSGLDSNKDAYNMYPVKGHSSIPSTSLYPVPETPLPAPPPRRIFGASTYRSISWMVGFKEKYSLLCFFIFGGALVGFCLARIQTLSMGGFRHLAVPGEWFWFREPMYEINLFIHIYFSIIGGLMVIFQFLPAIRRWNVRLHRLNGYMSLVMLIPGNICGSIVARRSFGGEINIQAAFYILGIMTIFAGLMGFYHVKRETRKHRKWMLRMVVYFSTIITARLVMLCARRIITDLGGYYSIWRCDQLRFVLTNATLAEQQYPQCFQPGIDTSGIQVPVLGNWHGNKLTKASSVRVVNGMSFWVATLIHVAGVEIYIRYTESANKKRYGFVLEPFDYEEAKDLQPHES